MNVPCTRFVHTALRMSYCHFSRVRPKERVVVLAGASRPAPAKELANRRQGSVGPRACAFDNRLDTCPTDCGARHAQQQ